MPKVMLFIDGSWLYANTPRLGRLYGKGDYHVDFGKLPPVLAEEVGKRLGTAELDIVRTYLFGSYPANYDVRDDEIAQRRRDFFAMLKEEHHYEVETFATDFRRHRLRASDRDPTDSFEPQEKAVDVALATQMVYLAAIPQTFDIAIAVIGDRDFTPALQHVRRLGKRVAIASIKESCAPELSDPLDQARVKDFDIMWLDDLLVKLELRYEPHLLKCEAPFHKGKPEVWTTFYPRKSQKFYCDACREEFNKQKQEQRAMLGALEEEFTGGGEETPPGTPLAGFVSRKFPDRGYGFIQATNGKSYYFHLTDLAPGLDFDQIDEEMAVEFEVRNLPRAGKAGAAQNVRRRSLTESEEHQPLADEDLAS